MLGGVETRSVSPVFVGRADELAVLTDALGRAAGQEPQALLIAGEAGVGKTRLIEEFTAEATRRGAAVAVGGCVEIGAEGLPFAPFSTALRALRRRLPEELAAAAAGQEDELARILPELGETPRGKHDEESTHRLFELTARLLERLAADRTVVLVLEDLHWADTSTRHLLAYLFRSLTGGRLVLVATYRADDIHRRHPLRPLLAELDRLRTIQRVELPRFNRAEVRRQVVGILSSQPDESFVDTVFERSDGNAFFVEELVATAGNGCRTGLTESLRDLLLVRVEVLPDAAQGVVRIVAEGGSTVEYPLLLAVSRLTEDELLDALRAAVGANILLATPDGDGYRFRHSLVREAVSDDLLPGERARVNRRYAEALEADDTLVRAEERIIRLASYWYCAGDPAKALPTALDASVAARRRHAYTEQLSLLERALDLWDSTPDEIRDALRPADYTEAYPPCGCDPATPLQRLDLLAEATVAARLGGERERALKHTKVALRSLEGATADLDLLRAAWFWTERSRLVASLARGDGWEELGTAQGLVKGLPPSQVHAEVLVRAAGWGMLHNPGPDNLAAAERAAEYARMVGAEETELNARITVGSLLTDAGDAEAGFAELHAVKDRAAALGLTSLAGRAYINLTSQLESHGESRDALAVAEAGVELVARSRLLDTEAWVRGNMAETLYSLGRWEEAAEAARRTLKVGQSAAPRGMAFARLSYLALARGELTEAANQLAAAHRSFGDHDLQPQHRIPLYRLAVGVAAGEGRLADVRAELAAAVGDGFPLGHHRYAWPLLLAAATAEADARGLPAADPGRAGTVDLIRSAARRLATPFPLWQAHAEYVRAELLRAEGKDTAADWTAVESAVRPLDRPYLLSRARHRLGEALLVSGGDRDHATALLREAHAEAERLGARLLREDLALLGQRARIPLTVPEAPAPAAPDTDPAEALGLTSRERDVLRLVAAGLSNRQIAEKLFISPKTASVHVSNILAKLGVSGRVEAAALSHRLRLFTPTA
ncbi:AAA family ATPase [Streptomyces sp. NPDC048603]|uniref:helix-turn-helix transcriptional regulator n=1 Tax=Streptomyces sp. NPDC048603 TaxID=3365577 RepID=UPI00371B68D4